MTIAYMAIQRHWQMFWAFHPVAFAGWSSNLGHGSGRQSLDPGSGTCLDRSRSVLSTERPSRIRFQQKHKRTVYRIISIKRTFQWFFISTWGSFFIRLSSTFAWWGTSRDMAPISATLKRDDRSVDMPSLNEYPYNFGLYSLRMFGMVKYCRHVFWPPIVHESPLFSVVTWIIFVASPPFPAVRLSPIAPIMSMSPGLSWCTELDGCGLRFPAPLKSQKKASFSLNCLWSFCNRNIIF